MSSSRSRSAAKIKNNEPHITSSAASVPQRLARKMTQPEETEGISSHDPTATQFTDSPSKKLRRASSSTVDTGSEEDVLDANGVRTEARLFWSKFTKNLFEMASSPENAQAVGFNLEGDCLEVRDARLLGSEILPKYFKHKNISSFIRQLNNYGFKMIASPSGCDNVQTYYHEHFRKGRMDLLGLIIRRGAKNADKTDNRSLQQEILAAREYEESLNQRLRILEQQNHQLALENASLMDENTRLKSMWQQHSHSQHQVMHSRTAFLSGNASADHAYANSGYVHSQQRQTTTMPLFHHPFSTTTEPGSSRGGSSRYASSQAASSHHSVIQTAPTELDPSNPNSLMQHMILEDDYLQQNPRSISGSSYGASAANYASAPSTSHYNPYDA